MRRLLACSIFTIALLCEVRRANACWLSGGDGSCPSGGGDSGPEYHSYGDPQLVKLDGALLLEMFSADDEFRGTGYGDDVRTEISLPVPADGSPPSQYPTPLADGYPPSFACGAACIAAWHTRDDAMIRAAIRDAHGWSVPIAFEPAIRAPAAAAFGDVMLVAWSAWVTDVGARVELRRVDRSGAVTGSWQLATGASHGHLSVTQTAIGGLVTWQRGEAMASGPASCWIDAQLLDATGAPTGTVLEQAIPECDADYYRGAPTAFANSVYRVVHGGLGASVPWFVVDPAARTIALDPLTGTLTGAIAQLAPLADGFALALSGFPSGIAHVTAGRVAQELALDGAPTIAATPDGGLTAAYADEGSVYLTAIPPTFDAIAEPQVIAARYEVDGGCATTSAGSGGLVALALFALRRSRRATP